MLVQSSCFPCMNDFLYLLDLRWAAIAYFFSYCVRTCVSSVPICIISLCSYCVIWFLMICMTLCSMFFSKSSFQILLDKDYIGQMKVHKIFNLWHLEEITLKQLYHIAIILRGYKFTTTYYIGHRHEMALLKKLT